MDRIPSHVYPTTSDRQRLLVAASCLGQNKARVAKATLTWGYV
jgi:hypothetical protein